MGIITQSTWNMVQEQYELGCSLDEIAKATGVHRRTIEKRSIEENWAKHVKVRDLALRAKAVEKIVDQAIAIRAGEPNAEEAFPILLDAMQRRIINALKEAADAATMFLKNHPDGMYLKQVSFNGGKTYGLTCEIIAPLAQALASCAEMSKDLPGVTINNTQINQAQPVQIEIKGV